MSQTVPVPRTPGVISPSPSANINEGDDYFAPTTRSSVRRSARTAASILAAAEEDHNDSSDPDSRARTRSRDPGSSGRRRRSLHPIASESFLVDDSGQRKSAKPKGKASIQNGHLAPPGTGKAGAREISRSPSPLGLIPIHKHAKVWIHKHEIPRKALHVSIGFFTLGLYAAGFQTEQIHPALMKALIPIATLDVVRRNWAAFNRAYIAVMGAFMRESEAHDKYNGVIFYLLGAWAVLRFLPKDVGVMAVVLLSWCDTAASTFGRLYGKYTPKIRQGKSLAGSAAAFLVGVGISLLFYGFIGPYFEKHGSAVNSAENAFAFRDQLSLPLQARTFLGLSAQQASITGTTALIVMSIVSGFVASASEAMDLFGLDDNLTIPILSGIGLWAFLKVFGAW